MILSIRQKGGWKGRSISTTGQPFIVAARFPLIGRYCLVKTILSNKNKKLFKAWDKGDPVDEWECERCKRIEGLQKNENPFVKKACIEKGMW